MPGATFQRDPTKTTRKTHKTGLQLRAFGAPRASDHHGGPAAKPPRRPEVADDSAPMGEGAAAASTAAADAVVADSVAAVAAISAAAVAATARPGAAAGREERHVGAVERGVSGLGRAGNSKASDEREMSES